MKLLNDKMTDGSRNFVLLPVGRTSPIRLLFRIFTLWGAIPTAYIPSLSESWIDFRYKKHNFSINDQYGDYWFFVNDPSCPDQLLQTLVNHFSGILNELP